MAQRGEFDLIRDLFRPLAQGDSSALDLKDDAAVLPAIGPGERWVVTTDTLVGDVHFLYDDPPTTLGRKALRTSLSDIAGMGARPVGYLFNLQRPQIVTDQDLEEIADGLAEDGRLYGVSLWGGDTVSTSGPLSLTTTVLGIVPEDAVFRRAAAQPGDDVWISGTLGDAAAGLRIMRGELAGKAVEPLVARYLAPEPRLELAQALSGLIACAMDVSDGLVGDLGHICEASGVSAEVSVPALPLSGAFERVSFNDDTRKARIALTGGDDYELLFTAPPEKAAEIEAAAQQARTQVTRIGTIGPAAPEGTPAVKVVDAEGNPMELGRSAFTHF